MSPFSTLPPSHLMSDPPPKFASSSSLTIVIYIKQTNKSTYMYNLLSPIRVCLHVYVSRADHSILGFIPEED